MIRHVNYAIPSFGPILYDDRSFVRGDLSRPDAVYVDAISCLATDQNTIVRTWVESFDRFYRSLNVRLYFCRK